jgi:hypothetical protein
MHNRSAVVLGTYSMIGCSTILGENLAPLVERLLVSPPASSSGQQNRADRR